MAVVCPSCSADAPARARFCPDCGTALEARCGGCGEPHVEGQRFCAGCGAALTTETATAESRADEPASRAGAPAELRHVSVLFCDLVGYTSLSDGRDADEVRDILSGYFDLARTVIERYGGSVEKFIGDAVMAVWGSSAAHEDDAERATRAALELTVVVEHYGDERGLSGLRARVGVATGQAAAVDNPDEGIVVGDRVNIAARVQSVAVAGGVLVDAATRELCAASFQFEDAGDHVLKGKAEPLHLWRPLRTRDRTETEESLEPAFVGRTRELELLKSRFHQVEEEGRAERVSVSGHAGLGKSRLHREFRSYLDGLAGSYYFHVGRCLSYGDGIAYWALAEMVRQRFGVAETDPEDTVVQRVEEALPQLIPEPFARPVVGRSVRVLLGVDDEKASRDELFAGWRLLFEQLAVTHPVVLVFEDVQWADRDLLDFLEQITDWSSRSPIFVLTLARPELVERRPDWHAARRNVTPLLLELLPDEAIGAILDDLVELPDDVRDRIIERADGTPLYAVEMVRVLLDRGQVVVEEQGRRTLEVDVSELDVPASLTALATARLDVLEPDERTLVRDLSVFGGGFPAGAVAAMTDLPEDAVDPTVRSLLRKGILAMRTDPLSPERGQLGFQQVLIRTTALESLPRRERVARHLRAARHLRSAFPNDGEEMTELIARHYRDAVDLAGDDRSLDSAEALDEAAVMFRRAGDRSRSLGASEAALRSYEAARECTSDPDEVAGLTALAADVAYLCGENDRASQLCEEAEEQLRAVGRSHEANRMPLIAARCRMARGDVQGAIDVLRSGLDRAGDDAAARAELLGSLTTKLNVLGDIDAAFDAAEEALSIAASEELHGILAYAAMGKAMVLSYLGRFLEFSAMADMAVDLLAEHGSLQELAVAELNRVEILLHGDRPGARSAEDEVILLARRAGDRPLERMAIGNRSMYDVLLGRWDEVIAACHGVGADDPSDFLNLPLAMVRALRGQMADAVRCADLLTPPEGNEDPQLTNAHALALGYVALGRGDHHEALRQFTSAIEDETDSDGVLWTDGPRYGWPRAVELAFDLGARAELAALTAEVADRPPGHVPPYLRAVLRFTEGRVAAQDGDLDGAEELLRAGLSSFEQMGLRYWHARSRIVLADLLLDRGRRVDAADELREAEQVLQPLGAVLDLSRLEAVRARASDVANVTVLRDQPGSAAAPS